MRKVNSMRYLHSIEGWFIAAALVLLVSALIGTPRPKQIETRAPSYLLLPMLPIRLSVVLTEEPKPHRGDTLTCRPGERVASVKTSGTEVLVVEAVLRCGESVFVVKEIHFTITGKTSSRLYKAEQTTFRVDEDQSDVKKERVFALGDLPKRMWPWEEGAKGPKYVLLPTVPIKLSAVQVGSMPGYNPVKPVSGDVLTCLSAVFPHPLNEDSRGNVPGIRLECGRSAMAPSDFVVKGIDFPDMATFQVE